MRTEQNVTRMHARKNTHEYTRIHTQEISKHSRFNKERLPIPHPRPYLESFHFVFGRTMFPGWAASILLCACLIYNPLVVKASQFNTCCGRQNWCPLSHSSHWSGICDMHIWDPAGPKPHVSKKRMPPHLLFWPKRWCHHTFFLAKKLMPPQLFSGNKADATTPFF